MYGRGKMLIKKKKKKRNDINTVGRRKWPDPRTNFIVIVERTKAIFRCGSSKYQKISKNNVSLIYLKKLKFSFSSYSWVGRIGPAVCSVASDEGRKRWRGNINKQEEGLRWKNTEPGTRSCSKAILFSELEPELWASEAILSSLRSPSRSQIQERGRREHFLRGMLILKISAKVVQISFDKKNNSLSVELWQSPEISQAFDKYPQISFTFPVAWKKISSYLISVTECRNLSHVACNFTNDYVRYSRFMTALPGANFEHLLELNLGTSPKLSKLKPRAYPEPMPVQRHYQNYSPGSEVKIRDSRSLIHS